MLDEAELYKKLKELTIEALILRTPTRFECYAFTDKTEKELLNAFGMFDLEDYMQVYRDKSAITHMLRLVCLIESKVLGESIAPYLLDLSLKKAKEHEAIGEQLEGIVKEALKLSEDICSKTQIRGTISVDRLAYNTLAKNLSRHEKVLIIGYSWSGINLAKRLTENYRVVITGRIQQISEALADDIDCDYVGYNEFLNKLRYCDAFVCSTLASHYTITYGKLTNALKDRDTKIYALDISPLGNLDPRVSKIPRVKLLDGRIRKAVNENLKRARNEVSLVSSLVEQAALSIVTEFLI